MKCTSHKIDRLQCTRSECREPTCNEGDLGLIPELGRSSAGGPGNPLQYFCLEKCHGQRSLTGSSPFGRKESDMTATRHTHMCTYSSASTPVVVQNSPPSNSRSFSFCKIVPDLLDGPYTFKTYSTQRGSNKPGNGHRKDILCPSTCMVSLNSHNDLWGGRYCSFRR